MHTIAIAPTGTLAGWITSVPPWRDSIKIPVQTQSRIPWHNQQNQWKVTPYPFGYGTQPDRL